MGQSTGKMLARIGDLGSQEQNSRILKDSTLLGDDGIAMCYVIDSNMA